MQQDSTDKILQRMESQQLPDLSQMDKHWEDMRGLLVVGAIAKPLVSATAKWMIAATLVGAIALFGWKKGWFSSGNNSEPSRQELTVKPLEQKQPDTLKAIAVVDTPLVNVFACNSPLNVVTSPVPFTYIANTDSNYRKSVPTNPIQVYESFVPSEKSDKQTEAMNVQLMQQFWNQVEKKAQQFVIDNRYDSKIEGAEGTSIKIPANAFPFVGDGKITIELTEFYDYGEMIANKLTTSSYQRQLVSDGMLRIKAMQNGKEIKMTGLKPMDVNMPRRDMSNDMQLFAGEWKNFIGNSKLINWIPMGQQQNYRFGFRDGSANAVLHPYAIHKRWFSKKKVVKYWIEKDKSMSAAATKKLIENSFQDIIAKVKKGEPRVLGLFPRKLSKEYWDYNYQLPPSRTGPVWVLNTGIVGYDTVELRRADSIQGRYNFSVTTTGWINCDRFSNDNLPKVEFTISGNKDEKIYCSYLVFKDIKSVLPSYANNNKCTFYDVPEGKNVTLITLGISNGKTICSMRDMKTERGDISRMRFEETNPEKFKERLLAMKL